MASRPPSQAHSSASGRKEKPFGDRKMSTPNNNQGGTRTDLERVTARMEQALELESREASGDDDIRYVVNPHASPRTTKTIDEFMN